MPTSERRRLKNRRRLETYKVRVDGCAWFVSVGYYETGEVGEIFLDTSKAGSAFREMMAVMGQSLSLAFQYGAPASTVVNLLGGTSSGSVFQVVGDVLQEARAVGALHTTSIADDLARGAA